MYGLGSDEFIGLVEHPTALAMTEDHPLGTNILDHRGSSLSSESTLLLLVAILHGHFNIGRLLGNGVLGVDGWWRDNNIDISWQITSGESIKDGLETGLGATHFVVATNEQLARHDY